MIELSSQIQTPSKDLRLSLKKRIYRSDIMVLHEIVKKGYGYTSKIAENLNVSVQTVNSHLRKTETLGWVERIGQKKCPYQWYRLPKDREIPIKRMLEYYIGCFQQHPKRVYYNNKWAWFLPQTKLLFQVPSVPFHKRGAESVERRLPVSYDCGFCVPYEYLEMVLQDLEELDEPKEFSVDGAVSFDFAESVSMGELLDNYERSMFEFVRGEFS